MSYTHECYTLLRPTELVREAISHVLSLGEGEVSGDLREDLLEWQEKERKLAEAKDGDKKQELHVLSGDSISFDLVRRVHSQLESTPLGRGHVWLHELLEGTELILPTIKPPKRNPQLVARLQQIQAQLDHKEYNKMTRDVAPPSVEEAIGMEIRSTSRIMWAVVNFLLTVVGSFLFGYFAAHYAGYDVAESTLVGLVFGIVVFIADMYFLLKMT